MLLSHLKDQFFDANVALNLFEEARSREALPPSREQWWLDIEREQEILAQLLAEKGLQLSKEYLKQAASDGVREEVKRRFKHERWAGGQMPEDFEMRKMFIFARDFVYALDGFGACLRVLSKESATSVDLSNFSKEFSDLFPDLREVRNTSHHLEDRLRGLGGGREPKPMKLKPFENNFIHAPYGMLVPQDLNGNRFCCTMGDGHYGEVEISPESLARVSDLLQRVLNSFQWAGAPVHEPRA